MGEHDLRNYSSGDFRREFRIDTSQSTRRIRERFTLMDLGQAGGVMPKTDLRNSFPLLRMRSLAELSGERTRETEVQGAIAMQILGLSESDAIEMRMQQKTEKVEKTESDDEIQALEVIELMEKMRAENPERFDEAVRIVNEEVEKERSFAVQIKRN